MKIKILLLLTFILPMSLFSQNSTYFIKFTDKDTTYNPFKLTQPEEFLSNRAIQRRINQNINIDLLDLPVSPRYKDSISKPGIQILNQTKWLNGVIAEVSDTMIDSLIHISFIEEMIEILPPSPKQKSKKDTTKNTQMSQVYCANLYLANKVSDRQIKMLNGHVLHQNGYRGDGMLISVIDGGFSNVTNLFDSLWNHNQILFTYDVHSKNEVVADDHYHGTYVLSIMGEHIPNEFIGTAPKANYILIRSEVTGYEYLIEEYYWAIAAEIADSAGTDIINSSLGYTTFDKTEQDHTYHDMDGNTTPAAIAADISSSRGIITVVSAGNNGNSSWQYISTPADADSVITVGAVDEDGKYASLSSTGPSADGDVKPTVAAMGQGTYFTNTSGNIGNGNGTSFAAPIICGLTACLWQKYPHLNNWDIIKKIINNSSRANNPDSLLGYGLPDFANAADLEVSVNKPKDLILKVYPNPFLDNFKLDIVQKKAIYDSLLIEIYNIMGTKVFSRKILRPPESKSIKIKELKKAEAGVYILKVRSEEKIIGKKKIIKQ